MTSLQQVLRDAVAAYQAGRFSEAEAGFRQVLRERPTDHLAFYGLALLSYQGGEKEQAIDYVLRSLRFEPNVGQSWNWLGTLYCETGRPLEGKAAFQRATQVSPDECECWCNLGGCLIREGDLETAVQVLRRALTCPQPTTRAYLALTNLLCRQERVGEAAQVASEWMAHEPKNPIARHLAAGLSGQETPPRAPDEYVRAYFDDFADGFDSVLKELNYQGPQLVASALQAAAPQTSRPAYSTILDAGCGTGLCGPLLREQGGRLVGVDLSPKMLDFAHQRGCYDELVMAELMTFMHERPQSFDAIASADTLIYFGPLYEPLAAAHTALRTGGVLAFTVEALLESHPVGHCLGVFGRYQHSEAYLRSVLAETGFTIESIAQQFQRKQMGRDVPGYLVVARRL